MLFRSSTDKINESIEELDTEHELPIAPLMAGFNITYLTQILATINTAQIVFKTNDFNKPAVITPVFIGSADVDSLFLVMPIMILEK